MERVSGFSKTFGQFQNKKKWGKITSCRDRGKLLNLISLFRTKHLWIFSIINRLEQTVNKHFEEDIYTCRMVIPAGLKDRIYIRRRSRRCNFTLQMLTENILKRESHVHKWKWRTIMICSSGIKKLVSGERN